MSHGTRSDFLQHIKQFPSRAAASTREENAEDEGLAMRHMKAAHKSTKNGQYSERDL